MYTETHSLDVPPYETWTGCPSCSGTYREAIHCDECEEYIVGNYIRTNGGVRVCENCYTIRDTEYD